MSKPYSEGDFAKQILDDRSWRLREISDLKSAVRRSDQIAQRVLLRAMIAICYAHWEGHVRFSAKKFLEHVALRKFQFRDLDKQFYRNHFLPRIGSLSLTKPGLAERANLVSEILNAGGERFARVNEDLVNTKSNLNFEVLSEICLVCGVPIGWFESKKSFIDIFLLKRRNAIAHGEEAFVNITDLDQLSDETVALMRGFGDELEKIVSLKTYRASTTTVPTVSTTT